MKRVLLVTALAFAPLSVARAQTLDIGTPTGTDVLDKAVNG